MRKYFCDMCGKEVGFDDRVELEFHNRINEIEVYREVCIDCCMKLLKMTMPKDGGQ